MSSERKRAAAVLFPGFELLDVYGPLEAFGGVYELVTVAAQAGPVASAQGPEAIAKHGFADAPPLDLLLVPGGIGTRTEVANERLLGWLARRAETAEVVSSVCTGAAILARAGLLDGKRATTNKAFFRWVVEQGPRVEWVREARWVDAGRLVTSAGVSAGIDMALHLIERAEGAEVAEGVARAMEYDRHRDAGWDPFARAWGLV